MFFLFSLIKEGLPRISPMVSIAPLAIYHPMRGKRGGGGMVKRQGRNFPLLLCRLLYLRIKKKTKGIQIIAPTVFQLLGTRVIEIIFHHVSYSKGITQNSRGK